MTTVTPAPAREGERLAGRPLPRDRQASRRLAAVRRSRLAVLVFLLPPLIFYVATVGVPIAEALALSLFRWYGTGPLKFIGLQNYTAMFADPTFRVAAVNSVVYLSIGLVIQVGFGLLLANALTYLRRWRELIRTLYLLPSILSTVAITLLFQRVYAGEPPGLINQVLSAVGLGSLARPWLSDLRTVLIGVSVPDGWRMMGIYTAILLGGLLTVPPEVEEAARLDGASEPQIFFKIRLPHLRPVLLTTLIMAATFGLRGFDIPYLLTNGGPGTSSELLTTYMYQTAFTSTNFGYASTLAVFIVVECLIAVGVIVLLLRRREA